MLRPRFFTAQELPENGAANLDLEAEPARHIARVLRMRVGERLCLFDGSGREAVATVASITRNQVQVKVEAPIHCSRESKLKTILAISLSRGDRMDNVVQKACELGVSEIWPLISERTEVKLDENRRAKKRDHWRKVAISACEQCGRNQIPDIAEIDSLASVFARADSVSGLRLLLHPGESPADLPKQCESLLLLIGPEGGFSDGEVATAKDAGFTHMVLGPRILRTETAPVAMLTLAQARWGDFPAL